MAIKAFSLKRPPSYPKITIFGPVGSGKTTLLGTLVHNSKCNPGCKDHLDGTGLLLDVPQVEGGGFVLADHAERIKGVTVETWEDTTEISNALQTGNASELPDGKLPSWVAIDSVTGMQQMALRKVIHERDRDLGDAPHKVTLQERGWVGQLTSELIYRYCSLPYTLIFIVQERVHGGKEFEPGPVQLGPLVQQSTMLALKPPMTIMGRLSVERGKRILTVGPPDGEYIVKARSMPAKPLPDRIRRPHLGKMLRYMFADGERPRSAKENIFL